MVDSWVIVMLSIILFLAISASLGISSWNRYTIENPKTLTSSSDINNDNIITKSLDVNGTTTSDTIDVSGATETATLTVSTSATIPELNVTSELDIGNIAVNAAGNTVSGVCAITLDDEGLLNINCGTISGVSSITGCSSQIDIGSSVTVEGDFQVSGLATLSTFLPGYIQISEGPSVTGEQFELYKSIGRNILTSGVSSFSIDYNLPENPQIGDRYKIIQQYNTGPSSGMCIRFLTNGNYFQTSSYARGGGVGVINNSNSNTFTIDLTNEVLGEASSVDVVYTGTDNNTSINYWFLEATGVSSSFGSSSIFSFSTI